MWSNRCGIAISISMIIYICIHARSISTIMVLLWLLLLLLISVLSGSVNSKRNIHQRNFTLEFMDSALQLTASMCPHLCSRASYTLYIKAEDYDSVDYFPIFLRQNRECRLNFIPSASYSVIEAESTACARKK